MKDPDKKRLYSAKETYDFKEPTNRRPMILRSLLIAATPYRFKPLSQYSGSTSTTNRVSGAHIYMSVYSFSCDLWLFFPALSIRAARRRQMGSRQNPRRSRLLSTRRHFARGFDRPWTFAGMRWYLFIEYAHIILAEYLQALPGAYRIVYIQPYL